MDYVSPILSSSTMFNSLLRSISLRVCLLAIFVFHPVWADDTEIFFSTLPVTDTQPNILFVLDASNSMLTHDCANGEERYNQSCNDGTPNGTTNRLDRMINAMNEVLSVTENVNVGMMRFGGYDGGRVLIPITDIDATVCAGCGGALQTQATIASSNDDAFEDAAGSVHTTDSSLPLMQGTIASQPPAGCDYSSAHLYGGWGWNPTTQTSCPPFTPQQSTGSASTTAMRFSNLGVPQGATIVSAEIVFTSNTDSAAGNTDLQFRIEDTGNSQPYVDGSSNTISNRSWASESVDWNFDSAWTNNEIYQSEDLTSLISHVVNRTDWCGGNALSLEVTGTGERQVKSFDTGNGAPILKVAYELTNMPAGGGCTTNSLVVTIDKSSGDAFETQWNGQVHTTQDAVHIRSDHMAGFQFDVPLDSDATVVGANLLLMGAWPTANNGSLDMNLAFEDSANPDEFSSSVNNLSQRVTMPGVNWNNVPFLDSYEERVRSVDISAGLRAILAKPDWQEGNRVSVLATYAGGWQRGFLTYDSWNTALAPKLEIVYQTSVQSAADVDTGVRTLFQNEMAEMKTVHGTPTVGALEEAMNYFAGNPVIFGKKRSFVPGHNAPPSSRVSSSSTYTGGTLQRGPGCNANNLNSAECASEVVLGNPVYQSPIKHECQANHVVILTDGQPFQEQNADHDALINRVSNLTLGGANCATTPFVTGGQCGEELVDYMVKTDFSDLPGMQNITTHTVGFNVISDWIRSIAELGGGGHYTAESTEDLVEALTNILTVVADVSTTFVAPATTVDQYSRISHREDVYFALFKPGATAAWQGNLKSYRLRGDPVVGLYGVNGLAVDEAAGTFRPTAKSYWSTETDGADTVLGGAASRLDPNSRNIVTYIDGSIENLISSANEISINNNAIDGIALGSGSNNNRSLLIDWLTGYDVKDEDGDGSVSDARNHIGDPLHSTPVLVTYDDSASSTKGDSVVFMGTNEGFLHAFNIGDGSESFAYMPYELLPNVSILYQNQSIVRSGDVKPYGMDGDLTLWTNDANSNGLIEEGDSAYIVAGMRRGGKNYYALDVSERDNPKFKWKIMGGAGEFAELGQTWSKPIAGKIELDDELTDVLIFAGGYDPAQDNKLIRSNDTIGRAIYIVDVESGALIWSGGPDGSLSTTVFSDMNYSIPSDLKVVEDGEKDLISQIYVGDMGGQIWRFDINNGLSGSDLVSGGVIADFGADDSETGNRRFYHSPDLSLSVAGGERILNVGIGSGYRAHPLDTVIEDKFFLFQYPYINHESSEYGFKDTNTNVIEPVTLSDLFDTTNNEIQQGSEQEMEDARDELAKKQGWFISMEAGGEKILGSATTLDFVVRFVSYVPQTTSVGCSANIGSSYYYSVNLLDGTPVNSNAAGLGNNLRRRTKEDRKRVIPSDGLAAAVNTVFVATGSGKVTPVIMSGVNVLEEGEDFETTKRWFWSEYPE